MASNRVGGGTIPEQLERRKREREAQIAARLPVGAISAGVDLKTKVETVDADTFKITFDNPVDEDQYCYVYALSYPARTQSLSYDEWEKGNRAAKITWEHATEQAVSRWTQGRNDVYEAVPADVENHTVLLDVEMTGHLIVCVQLYGTGGYSQQFAIARQVD